MTNVERDLDYALDGSIDGSHHKEKKMTTCDYCARVLRNEQKDITYVKDYLTYRVPRFESNFPDMFYFCNAECRDSFIQAAKHISNLVEAPTVTLNTISVKDEETIRSISEEVVTEFLQRMSRRMDISI